MILLNEKMPTLPYSTYEQTIIPNTNKIEIKITFDKNHIPIFALLHLKEVINNYFDGPSSLVTKECVDRTNAYVFNPDILYTYE